MQMWISIQTTLYWIYHDTCNLSHAAIMYIVSQLFKHDLDTLRFVFYLLLDK